MAMLNTSQEYGALTKFFHWIIAALFAFQYFAGHAMLEHFGKGKVLGVGTGYFFSWHKSIGLIALAIILLRLINRRFTRLPDWAPTLTAGEKKLIHRYEVLLYAGMLIMPISGYLYVAASGYDLDFLTLWKLPHPIEKWQELGVAAKWAHIASGWVILGAILAHLAVVLRHQFFVRDNLLGRMLFGRKARALGGAKPAKGV